MTTSRQSKGTGITVSIFFVALYPMPKFDGSECMGIIAICDACLSVTRVDGIKKITGMPTRDLFAKSMSGILEAKKKIEDNSSSHSIHS